MYVPRFYCPEYLQTNMNVERNPPGYNLSYNVFGYLFFIGNILVNVKWT